MYENSEFYGIFFWGFIKESQLLRVYKEFSFLYIRAAKRFWKYGTSRRCESRTRVWVLVVRQLILVIARGIIMMYLVSNLCLNNVHPKKTLNPWSICNFVALIIQNFIFLATIIHFWVNLISKISLYVRKKIIYVIFIKFSLYIGYRDHFETKTNPFKLHRLKY